MSATEPMAGERADLLQSLATQRHFLRRTTEGHADIIRESLDGAKSMG